MKAESFSVLVIDDNKEVLRRLHDVVKQAQEYDGRRWKVILYTLYVEIIPKEDKYQISQDTITKLSELLQNDIDLILLDYGYRNKDFTLHKLLDRFGEEPSLELLKGFLFTAPDLKSRSDELDLKEVGHNLDALFSYTGKIIVYTYGHPKFAHLEHTPAIKENLVKNLFFHADEVLVLDTRMILFNGNEFDEAKYDRLYYSFLVAKYLDLVIHNELLQFILSRKKYLSLRRTVKIVGIIAAVGISVGVISEFLGSMIVEFIEKGQSSAALFAFIVAVLFVLFVSFGIVKMYEKKIDLLFPSKEE